MIREITKADFETFWPCFEAVVRAQETYAFDPEMSFEDAYQLWCVVPLKTFVFEKEGKILASYYIKPNAMGPGDHVCNCGYMVSEAARGQGIAGQLCEHSQQVAIDSGFKAMQFNAVVSTNQVAVRAWQKAGFSIVGTLPGAYRHGRLGYVDSFVMYKQLQA
ncbi:MAG: GNAT family N-acetyltransferase [Thiolinea sp.]